MTDVEIEEYINSIKNYTQFDCLANLYCPGFNDQLIKYIYSHPENFKLFFDKVLKGGNDFTLNNKGVINLSEFPHMISTQYMREYNFSFYWIILPNLTSALLKNIPSYQGFGKFNLSEENMIYSNDIIKDNEFHLLLVPEIAKQLDLECAEYFLAKTSNSSGFTLSPNFLKEDERLLSGDFIIGNDTKVISIILKSIENNPILKTLPSDVINKLKLDFIKQSFFNKFIGSLDETNGNWGIITSETSARIAPLFDIDFSCDIYSINSYNRVSDDNSSSILSFLGQYINYPGFKTFLDNFINTFDIEKAFNSVKIKHDIEINNEAKNHFRNFFNSKLNEIKYAYNFYKKDNKNSNDNKYNDER